MKKQFKTSCVTLILGLCAAGEVNAETLSIAEAMQKGANRAPVVASAHAGVEAAEASVDSAQAGYWPQIQALANYAYSRPQPEIQISPAVPPVTLGTSYNLATGLGLGWRLPDLSRIRTVDAAENRVRGAQADVASSVLDVERRVRDLYLGVVYLSDVEEATVVARDATAKAAQNLRFELEAGLASEVDVAAAESRLAEYESRLLTTQAQHASALASLKVMLGIKPTDELVLSDTIESAVDLASGEPSAEHPSVVSTLKSAEALQLDASAITARWFPAFDVTGMAQYRYPKTVVDDEAGVAWSVGAQLTWLVWDGGARGAGADALEAKARSVRAAAEAQREGLAIEAADARARIEAADASLNAARVRFETASAYLILVKGSLEAGTAQVLDVLEAEVQVDQARLGSVSAKYDLARAKSALWRTQGIQFSGSEQQR